MEPSADVITEARAAIENAGRHDADELSPVAWFADFTLAPDPAAFAFSAMHGLRRFYPGFDPFQDPALRQRFEEALRHPKSLHFPAGCQPEDDALIWATS